MRSLTWLALALVLGLTVVTVATPAAQAGGYYYGGYGYYQPYYSNYSYNYGGGYYYCSYYYQPYQYNYCIYNGGYAYYYNPYSRQYWGRYDFAAKGYSLLAKEHRKGSLDEIKPEWFPKPGAMPAIPGLGRDDLRMDPPPAPPAEAQK